MENKTTPNQSIQKNKNLNLTCIHYCAGSIADNGYSPPSQNIASFRFILSQIFFIFDH
uniref:Uncharacterized protein n=1 Tax=Arundo donax TaxID=35708 RepID=A0A0A9GF46_ARUDO